MESQGLEQFLYSKQNSDSPEPVSYCGVKA